MLIMSISREALFKIKKNLPDVIHLFYIGKTSV